MAREFELLELRGKIQLQLKAIQKELGEGEELRQKLEAAGMPEEVKAEAFKELNRLDEAEIRGRRRTYIGTLPRQIIQSLRQPDRTTRCSCWMKWISWGAISAAIRHRLCW